MNVKPFLAALTLLCAPLAASEVYFPPQDDLKWERVDAAAAGWDAAALEAALDFAGERHSSAVVVLFNGKILAERQWDPEKQGAGRAYGFELASDGQVLEDVASVQKSVTSALFGIARRLGLIDFDEPVIKHLGKGWSKATPTQEAKITFRHLLTMTSGLTERLTFEQDPGTKWQYNSTAYQNVTTAVAQVAGKSVNEVTAEWLTAPIGMSHSRWRERPNMPGSRGFVSTARDLARFGLLIQADGVWAGRKIIEDQEYLRMALRPSQQLNPSYGLLWWLNGHRFVNTQGKTSEQLIETAPKDLVAALGALGRKVYVAPSLGIVVTRTGDNPDGRGLAPFQPRFWELLMRAAPGAGASRQ